MQKTLSLICGFASWVFFINLKGEIIMKKNRLITLAIKLLMAVFFSVSLFLLYSSPSFAATKASKEAVKQEISQMLYSVDTSTHSVYKYRVTSSEFQEITDSLKNGDCRLIWASYYSKMYVSYTTKSGYVYEMRIVNVDPDVLKRYENLKRNVDTIMAGIEPQMTDLDKIIYLHDCLVDLCSYRYVEYQSYGACGALGDREAVCSGYTKAYNMLLDMVGIKAEYTTSKSLNHAWTRVLLDGQWYHVDTTWDDTRSSIKGLAGHKNMLCNDKEFEGWSSHVDWYDSEIISGCTSTRFSDWFLHNHVGSMIFEDGYWFFVDENTNDIVKTKATGEDMQVVLYGAGMSTIKITNVTKDIITYIVDGKEYETNNSEAIPTVSVGKSVSVTVEEPKDEAEEPIAKEEAIEPLGWNDFSLWEMGKYDSTNSKVVNAVNFMHYKALCKADSLSKYSVELSAGDLSIKVYELDAEGKEIVSHIVSNGGSFTTASNCNSFSIELFCHEDEWRYNSNSFKKIFNQAGFNINIFETEKNAKSLLIGTKSFANFSEWRVGQYESNKGIAFSLGAKTRICLKDYVIADPNLEYKIVLNQEKYKLQIIQLNSKYKVINSKDYSDGDTLLTDKNCKFLAITLFSPSLEWGMNLSKYESLFSNIEIGIISPLTSDEDSVAEEEPDVEFEEGSTRYFNDLDMWENGRFDNVTNSKTSYIARLVLAQYCPVEASAEYTVDLISDGLGLVIYELDENGNSIINHTVENGSSFTTASNCKKLSIEVFCPGDEWRYSNKEYRSMLKDSKLSVGITRTNFGKNVFGAGDTWSDLSEWRCGQYSDKTGKFTVGAKTRVSLDDYQVVESNAPLTIEMNNEDYRLNIIQLDNSYGLIEGDLLKDGDEFVPKENCKYVAVTLYSPKLEWSPLSYSKYETLFSEGFSISVTGESEPTVSIESTNNTDIAEDENVEERVEEEIVDTEPVVIINDNVNINDVSLWENGRFDSVNSVKVNYIARLILSSFYPVNSSTEYTVSLSNDELGLMVYELDDNEKTIVAHYLKGGMTFTTASNCSKLSIELYCPNEEWKYSNKEYKAMFKNGSISVGINRTDSKNNVLSDGRVWDNLLGWRVGQYSAGNGKFSVGAKTRVCLDDYKVLESTKPFTVTMNNVDYRLEIVQMDSTYSVISSGLYADGDKFIPANNCKFVAVTLYSPKLEWSPLSYAKYEALFAGGFKIELKGDASVVPEVVPGDTETEIVPEVVPSDTETEVVLEENNTPVSVETEENTNSEVVVSVEIPDVETMEQDNHVWNDVSMWRSGEFSNSTGEYFEAAPYRVCLNDYIVPMVSSYYSVSLNNSNYKVFIYQLDENKSFISMGDYGNGDELNTLPNCKYLAVTLHDVEKDTQATYAEFEEAFTNGLSVGISRILSISDEDVPSSRTATDIRSGPNYVMWVGIIAVLVLCTTAYLLNRRMKKK